MPDNMKNIHIPTIDELMKPEDKVYGVLVSDYEILKYYDFKDSNIYTLANEFGIITAITIKDDDVLYSCGRKIKTLFSRNKIIKESLLGILWRILFDQHTPDYEAFSLEEHNGTLLDTSNRGLENTLEGKVLISADELEVSSISYIKSLAVDGENNLFGLVCTKPLDSCFVELTRTKTGYEITRLIKYNDPHPNKAIIVPYGNMRGANGKEYPFSALCACANTLYLNENELYKSSESINTFEVVSLQGNSAKIILPSKKENCSVTLNLANKTKQDPPRVFYHGLFDFAKSMKAVKSFTLHEKLLELGKKNVRKN